MCGIRAFVGMVEWWMDCEWTECSLRLACDEGGVGLHHQCSELSCVVRCVCMVAAGWSRVAVFVASFLCVCRVCVVGVLMVVCVLVSSFCCHPLLPPHSCSFVSVRPVAVASSRFEGLYEANGLLQREGESQGRTC